MPAALTSLLLTLQPVGSVALAALIFAESPTPMQLAGVVLVLAALLDRDAAEPRSGPRSGSGSGDRGRLGQALERRPHVLLGELGILERAGQERVVGTQIEVTVA